MTTATTTIYDIIDDVNAYLDQVAAESDMTPTEARDAAHTGKFGERGKIAHEVWYAHQYDGIVGDAVERWQGAQLETDKMTTTNYTTISISLDGIWAGSGKLVDGRIEDCGAQFCDDNDASLAVYDLIESAIAAGRNSLTTEIDGERKTLTWSIVEAD